jgi:polyhydroxybutyrate depolymerase
VRALPALLLAACTTTRVPTAGPPDGGWVTGRYTVDHDGRDRTFWLDVPPALPDAAPVVLLLHGYTDSATAIRADSGFPDLAAREGFLLITPDGTKDARGNRFFDVGYDFHPDRVDDAGLLRALAARMIDDLGADPAAVFATGMSNGGDMSYLLACEDEPFVAAIAPVAGAMFGTYAPDCAPTTRVSVAELHGTHDDVTWWDGDLENEGGWGPYWGQEQGIEHWVAHLGLDQFEETELPDRDPDDGQTVSLFRAWTDLDRAEVRLYTIHNGGHTWPGTSGTGDIDAAEEIWSFFAGRLGR